MRRRKHQFKPYSLQSPMNGTGSQQSGDSASVRVQFVTPTCPNCRRPIPPGNKLTSVCDKCWALKGDGRATARSTAVTQPICTKAQCRGALDLVNYPNNKRCRRCREESLRERRGRGVAPSKGSDPMCPQCHEPMVDDKFPICAECEQGPLAKPKRSRKPNTLAGPSTSPSAASSSSRLLPPISPVSPRPSGSSPNTPHSLSLTPLSMDDTLGSSSSFTSYNGTPYSPYAINLPPVCPDGRGPEYNFFPGGYNNPQPHIQLQAHSPVTFSTRLLSVPLPDMPNTEYGSMAAYGHHIPLEAVEDDVEPAVHQHLLFRNSVFPPDNVVVHDPGFSLPPVGLHDHQPDQRHPGGESFVELLNSPTIPRTPYS